MVLFQFCRTQLAYLSLARLLARLETSQVSLVRGNSLTSPGATAWPEGALKSSTIHTRKESVRPIWTPDLRRQTDGHIPDNLLTFG